MWGQLDTVEAYAEILRVTPGTVRRWIRNGLLVAEKRRGRYFISSEANASFVVEKIEEKYDRPSQPYVPKEIGAYERWHTVLDELCWLLKVTYSTRGDLKARRFRLDQLFANYLRPHLDRAEDIAKALGPEPNRPKLVASDLRRGWYNELAFALPLKRSTLGLSFRDIELNQETSNVRFVFPSWRIVVAYYASYFYLRALTLQKEPAVRIQRHDATINAFKFNVIPALSSTIWSFPISILWAPRQRVSRRELPIHCLPHLRYQYARHPRAPYRTPMESFEFLYAHFRRRAQARKNPVIYTIVDLLREFRVWANYIDIDNVLSLWGSGFRSFLDQNLSTVTFFLAGVSEVGFIAVRGAEEYLQELQAFYDGFVCNNEEIEDVFTGTPIYHRMCIYSDLGLTGGGVRLRSHPDINAVSI